MLQLSRRLPSLRRHSTARTADRKKSRARRLFFIITPLQCGTNGFSSNGSAAVNFVSNFGVNDAATMYQTTTPTAIGTGVAQGINTASTQESDWGFLEYMVWSRNLSQAEFFAAAQDLATRCAMRLLTAAASVL